jgi:exodeoxyribonuclease VII small subunit
MQSEEKRSFEQALSELEEHVRRLDGGDLELEEFFMTFEFGVKLICECFELLDDAEQRITELTENGNESEANA